MKIYPKLQKYEDLEAVFFKLSEEEHNVLLKEISPIEEKINEKKYDELRNIGYNHRLAGHIKHQYALRKDTVNYIQKIMRPAVLECILRYNRSSFLSDKNLIITGNNSEKCWVNFQKKYEFNPLHQHAGIFSFVLWIKIPYLMEDESKFENIVEKNDVEQNYNGDFQFVIFNSAGVKGISLKADNKWEKRGVIFPSNLNHIVYPFFTSDDFRISISGNYWIK